MKCGEGRALRVPVEASFFFKREREMEKIQKFSAPFLPAFFNKRSQ
jgi:hypothetical protein